VPFRDLDAKFPFAPVLVDILIPASYISWARVVVSPAQTASEVFVFRQVPVIFFNLSGAVTVITPQGEATDYLLDLYTAIGVIQATNGNFYGATTTGASNLQGRVADGNHRCGAFRRNFRKCGGGHVRWHAQRQCCIPGGGIKRTEDEFKLVRKGGFELLHHVDNT